MSDHSFALSVEMPDDEPRQIVCTGDEAGADIWQPAFGVWEADDFGIDADETVGDGERLYVSRRIYDAMAARLADAEAMAEALRQIVFDWDGEPEDMAEYITALAKWRAVK